MYSRGCLGVHRDHKNGTFDYLHQCLFFFYIETWNIGIFFKEYQRWIKNTEKVEIWKNSSFGLIDIFLKQSKPKSPGKNYISFFISWYFGIRPQNKKNGKFGAEKSIFGLFSLNIWWPYFELKSEIFGKFDAIYQMSHSYSHNEPLNSP